MADKAEIVINKAGYRELLVNGELQMSDIPEELDQYEAYLENYRGDILILGLGMGVINDLTDYDRVTSMDVVEIYPEVVQLNKKYPKTRFIVADARTYKPEKLYDTIWLDIWNLLYIGNLKDMTQMREKFRQYLKPGGWIESWGRAELQERYGHMFNS